MADVNTIAAGGKPNQGTKKDKRLKENDASKKPWMSSDELQAISDLINQLTAAPETATPDVDPHAGKGTPFTVLIMIEGLETSDGRMFELGGTTWREPIPFMVQDTSPHGPGQIPLPAWAAGQVEQLYRDPDDETRIMGAGHLMDNEAGARAEEIIRGAFRGVSVDAYDENPVGPDVQPTVVDQDGWPVDVLLRYSEPTINRVTLVPTPAFEMTCIWLADEEMPAIAQGVGGGEVDRDAEPEVVEVKNPFEMLVASAGGPLNPPRDWFFTPEPDRYQPMEVTADGRISGHIAPFGQCYLNDGKTCETAPRSNTVPPYKSFHRTEAECGDGTRVACGFLTMGTKHERALFSVQPGQAMDHYDHTGTIGAKVRCSNGVHGIWASGALLPGLADRELAILQGPEVSGDWRRWQDPEDGSWHALELLGLLAVPVPAYPGARSRPELLVASGGQIIGQFGSLDPTCDECNEEAPLSAADLARIERLESVVGLLLGDASEDLRALAGLSSEDLAALAAFTAEAATAEPEDAEVVAELEIDLTAPLTPSEMATWFAKYDGPQRVEMAMDGRARPDGSVAIGDAADLVFAVRAAGAKPSPALMKHLARNAERLGAQLPTPAV